MHTSRSHTRTCTHVLTHTAYKLIRTRFTVMPLVLSYLRSPASSLCHPTNLSLTTTPDPVTTILLLNDKTTVLVGTVHCLSIRHHVLYNTNIIPDCTITVACCVSVVACTCVLFFQICSLHKKGHFKQIMLKLSMSNTVGRGPGGISCAHILHGTASCGLLVLPQEDLLTLTLSIYRCPFTGQVPSSNFHLYK